MRKSDLFFNAIRLPIDFIMLLAAGLATYFFRTEILSFFRPVLFEVNLPLLKYLYIVFFVALFLVGVFAISGLYSMKTKIRASEEFLRIVIASSSGMMLLIIFIFLRQELFDSRFLVLGGWFLAITFVVFGRFLVRVVQRNLVVNKNFGVQNVIIVGNDESANKLDRGIKTDPATGYRVADRFDFLDVEEIKARISLDGVDEIILSHIQHPEEKIVDLVELCQEKQMAFKYVPHVAQILTSNFDIQIFKGLPILEIKRTSLDGWGSIIKRIFDIVSSVVGLVLISPVLAIISFAIKWETEGPVFVKLKRVSRNRNFLLYKFRSMIENAEGLKPYLEKFNERQDGPLFKIKNDPRVTKVGRVIRMFRLDELPQFINILKGDMSMIGPRPHQPDEIVKYEKHHKKVLAIKAGATGLAQVSGSSDLSFEQEVALDSYYIDNWSLWLDLKIIIRTIMKVVFDKSAV